MRARFLQSRFPQMIESAEREEEGHLERSQEDGRRGDVARDRQPGRIAFICDLDKLPTLDEGSDLWRQIVPGELDASWLARAAGFSDLAIFISSKVEKIASASVVLRACAAENGTSRPPILGGVFTEPNEDVDFLWTHVDGLILGPRNDEPEAEIAAEQLRRTAATIGETLLLARGTWKEMPSICIWARLDVLSLLPRGICQWMILDMPPKRPFSPGAKKLVLSRSQKPEWWMEDYSVVGPDSIWWRPWMRHPKVAAVG